MILSSAMAATDMVTVHRGGEQPGHYLEWHGRPVLLIGDSVTQGWMETGTNFIQSAYIDALSRRGINLLMLWAYIGTDSAVQEADGRLGYNAPELWPWAGSTDSNSIDLHTFNQAYFDRLRSLVSEAERKDIVVLITVHDGWPKTRFAQHPFSAANGNGPLTAQGQFVELADYDAEMPSDFEAGWSRAQKNKYFQERFCNKLIAELRDYSNVLYEMFNEGEWYDQTQRRAHEQHFLGFFRARCANLLLSNSDHVTGDDPHNDPKVDIVAFHSSYANQFGRFQTGFNTAPAKPYLDTEPVPSVGVEATADEGRRILWEVTLAGAGIAVQNDLSFGWDSNSALAAQTASRDAMYDYEGHCSRFFNGTNKPVAFANMRPDGAAASTGMCLAKAGAEYVVYSPAGSSSFTVNLSASGGNTFSARWCNPRNGQTTTQPSVSGGSAAQPFSKPDSNDWVLHLKVLLPVGLVVVGNGVPIPDGDTMSGVADHTDFGGAALGGGSAARTFSIHNSAVFTVTLGMVTLSGPDAADFAVTRQPASNLAGGGNTTFTVQFQPSSEGLRTASVSVPYSGTNADTHEFVIRGTGTEVNRGLEGWWKLDETNGVTASDSSGHGHDGTLVNGPAWVAAWTSNGLAFDGNDDYVNVGDPASGLADFGATQSFSFGAWFNATVADATGRRLLAKRGGSGPADVGFDLAVWNGTLGLLAELADGAVEKTTALVPIPLTLNQWHAAMVVVDRDACQMRVYLDAVERTVVDLTGLGSLSNSQPLNLGRTSGDSTRSFHGVLDDVRIYRRALLPAEVLAVTYPPPQFQPPVRSGGQIQLNWIGNGRLESAPAVVGPWTPVLPVPVPPHIEDLSSETSRLFRLNAGP